MRDETAGEETGLTERPPRSGLVQLLSELFRPRRYRPPIPDSPTRVERLFVELYRSLVT